MNLRWTVPMALLVLVAGGCGSGWGLGRTRTVDASSGAPKMVEPTAEIPAQAGSPIADVPVPVGFRLDESDSRNFTAAGARVIEHIYTGSADKITVARFFKRQMPTTRWALMRDVFLNGQIQLDFDNQRETCHVTITDGSWFKPTRVRILVLPTGRSLDDPSAQRLSMR